MAFKRRRFRGRPSRRGFKKSRFSRRSRRKVTRSYTVARGGIRL